MGTRLTLVSFDIETTGLEVRDEVTVIGFVLPLGCRVFLQTGGRPVECGRLRETLLDRFGPHVDHIQLTAHETERDLLTVVHKFVGDRLASEDYLLTAYNGERFRAGFDLPFLRTRFRRQTLDWPFVDLPYADLLPIFQHRFNTLVDGDDASDLERVYEVLVGEGLTATDPFSDSSCAVAAFADSDFEALVAHNVADILRTDALGTVAEQYCSKSEFQLKSLTPTARDPQLE